MKKLLWKPTKTTWHIHVVISLAAIIAMIMVESFKVSTRQPYYQQKFRASKIMKKGMDYLKDYRIKNIGPINSKIDVLKSGMLGSLSSPITSNKGSYDSKLTTINPNWAAVIVDMLKKAKVRDGSTIAVSFSGSFPALNLAVFSAAKAMNLKVIIITSASSSSWGANIPGFSWLDMERVLNEKGLFPYRSFAASLGGARDMAIGMSTEGKAMLLQTIKKNGIPYLEATDEKKAIDLRMELYLEKAGEVPIAAYINVGGGILTVGSTVGKKRYRPGLNLSPSIRAMKIDSVLTRFAKTHTPVIFLTQIKDLAVKYDIPLIPEKIARVGVGTLYIKSEYNNLLVVSMLILLLLMLFFFIRMGFGYRIFSSGKTSYAERPPEHMV